MGASGGEVPGRRRLMGVWERGRIPSNYKRISQFFIISVV